ncbi:MAG: ABC transporter permease [Deferribacteres bacterium]|nr:ABC transporter permease [candidate division KSB1 bacterium]MCB9502330.1 ABC transporter permease [Deferribacteres bacterium]
MVVYLTQALGRNVLQFLERAGGTFILLAQIIFESRTAWRDRRIIIEQMHAVGVMSLPLVSVTSLFTGAVSAWQAAYQFEGMVSLTYLGGATAIAIFMELGPVLTALVLAGRVGASIAAELGTMKVTEQIDALECLAISPARYLAMPRFWGVTIMLPILTVYANIIALFGAYVVAYTLLEVSGTMFFDSVQTFFELRNVLGGLTKSVAFGATISLVGCYVGFQTHGGAEGVGRSTIDAFVLSAILILINDYILALLIF